MSELQEYKIEGPYGATYFVSRVFDSALSQVKKYLERNGTEGYQVFQQNTGIKYIHADGSETPRWKPIIVN